MSVPGSAFSRMSYSPTATRFCGCLNGSGRNNTALTTLNTAVLAPIPSASVSTTTQAKPGDFPSWRKANLRSFISLVPQRLHRIDIHRATRREISGDQSRAAQSDCDDGVNRNVMRAHAVEQTRHQSHHRQRSEKPDEHADPNDGKALTQDHCQHIDLLRSECHANADLFRALRDAVGNHPVNSDRG